MKSWEDFKSIVIVDYEFIAGKGERQRPLCYVAYDILAGQLYRRWLLDEASKQDYPNDRTSLTVAFMASAEFGCYLPLNFPLPTYVVDLFAEFRCQTNGLVQDSSLIGACNYFNLPSSSVIYKETMIDRILQGPPYTEEEQLKILDYCQKDVEMTVRLFQAMKSSIDLNYALLRGRYMTAVAHMEYRGIPVNVEMLNDLKNNWNSMKNQLIAKVDKHYGVFDGTTFKHDRYEAYLERNDIPIEYTEHGRPKTSDSYLKELAKTYPQLGPLRELKVTLGQLKLAKLEVGTDGRLRTSLRPFSSKTARNYPRKYIFGNAVWTRNLIKPQEGMAVSYIDYEQQELAIAAVLSGDTNLIAAYRSGDPYTAFAKVAGAIPPDGSKQTHPDIRERYKTLMLGTNYGLSERAFALRANISLAEAHRIMVSHKINYRRYWEWSDNSVGVGFLSGRMRTNYGWYLYTKFQKPNTLKNWPMQSTGADILRLAICFCIEKGVIVIAPIHDAILIEAPIEEIDARTKIAQKCMEDASEWVIDLRIRTEVKSFCYPDRFTDKRGEFMWNLLLDCLKDQKECSK